MRVADQLIQVRVDGDVKQNAVAVLQRYGLTVSDAVRLLFTQIAADGTLPLDFSRPRPARPPGTSFPTETSTPEEMAKWMVDGMYEVAPFAGLDELLGSATRILAALDTFVGTVPDPARVALDQERIDEIYGDVRRIALAMIASLHLVDPESFCRLRLLGDRLDVTEHLADPHDKDTWNHFALVSLDFGQSGWLPSFGSCAIAPTLQLWAHAGDVGRSIGVEFSIGDANNFEAFGRAVADHSQWFDGICSLGRLTPQASNPIDFENERDAKTPSVVVRELFAQVVAPLRERGDDAVESISFGAGVDRHEQLLPALLAATALLLFAHAAVSEDRASMNSALGFGLSAHRVVQSLWSRLAGQRMRSRPAPKRKPA